jgi:hypothetical protein
MRAQHRPERVQARLRDRVDEVERSDSVMAAADEVLAENGARVRPGDDGRALQPGACNDRLNLARPSLALGVERRLEGLVRGAVAAQVPRHAPVSGERGALHLPAPRERALREPVDEEHLGAPGIAPLVHGETYPVGRR